MANRPRRKDEKYSRYKASLAEEAKRLKAYLRGRLIWDSSHDGTYRRVR